MLTQKRILIVCRYFYPHISPRSFRATELAKEFARQGHEVTVLMLKQGRDYSEFESTYNIKIKDLGKLRFKNITLKGKGPLLLFSRALRRVLSLIFEYPDIELMFKVAKALKKEKGYDLLISIAVPHPIHWGVAQAWKKNQTIAKKWVADCGDPYIGCKTDSFKKMFYFKYLEKWFCRKADFISVPVATAIPSYYPEFRHKIKVIPQGFYFDETVSESNVSAGKKDHPVFAYAGGFIPGIRDPRPFLDFLCSLKINFTFIVHTSSPELIKPYKEKLKHKLEIHDVIPREELLQNLRKMDFLVNFDNNTKNQIPSKLIDYAIIGKPVINITRNFNYEIVKEFLHGNFTHKMELPDTKQFHITAVCRQFLDLLDITND